jgi:hypothetical protein
MTSFFQLWGNVQWITLLVCIASTRSCINELSRNLNYRILNKSDTISQTIRYKFTQCSSLFYRLGTEIKPYVVTILKCFMGIYKLVQQIYNDSERILQFSLAHHAYILACSSNFCVSYLDPFTAGMVIICYFFCILTFNYSLCSFLLIWDFILIIYKDLSYNNTSHVLPLNSLPSNLFTLQFIQTSMYQ